MLWLVLGIALFSGMARLHPRYTEALTPAVAATLGIGVAWATERRTRWRAAALTTTLIGVTIYAQWLLFGTTAVWLIGAVGAAGALALTWLGGQLRPGSQRGATASTSASVTASEPAATAARPEGMWRWRSAATLALALVALLAIPLSTALRDVRENASDTNRLGVLHAGELQPLSSYLRAHQGDAYYEAAFDSGTKMGELVVRDARPILVLSTLNGKVFTSVARLRALAATGRVRYAFLDTLCGSHSPPSDADCTAPARWVAAHGVDVSRQAGLPRPGMLWRLP
jgi:hypothetical protein